MAGALAINGATVVICGRRQDVLDATAKELNVAADESGAGGKVIAIQADVATKQGVVDFYDKCKDVIHKVRPNLGRRLTTARLSRQQCGLQLQLEGDHESRRR
jgi:NAD(P)-dependent dehydrogenase (short-subunit alcohol dehydrogenase family)